MGDCMILYSLRRFIRTSHKRNIAKRKSWARLILGRSKLSFIHLKNMRGTSMTQAKRRPSMILSRICLLDFIPFIFRTSPLWISYAQGTPLYQICSISGHSPNGGRRSFRPPRHSSRNMKTFGGDSWLTFYYFSCVG